MNQKTGVGVIGCGNISAAYFRLASLFRNIKIKSCADLNLETAKNQAEEFGIVALDVASLLKSSEIEIIVNLTVPDAHYEVSKSILEAGKHVYSEKPLTLSLPEALQLHELAETKGLLVAGAPDTFLGGVHQQARDLVDSGAIGRITGGTCHVMDHGMEHWHPNPDFFYQPGGGPILDLGPYYLGNLINLIGPISRVTAFSSTPKKVRTITSEERFGETIPVKTPTTVHALLQFDNGALVTLGASWDVWDHGHPHMELYGTEGTLRIPDPNIFSGVLQISARDGGFDPVPKWDHPFGIENEEYDSGWIANYRSAGLADLARAIREGREARCLIQRPLHAVEVMTGILQSAKTGRAIEMATTCTRPDPLGPEDAETLI